MADIPYPSIENGDTNGDTNTNPPAAGTAKVSTKAAQTQLLTPQSTPGPRQSESRSLNVAASSHREQNSRSVSQARQATTPPPNRVQTMPETDEQLFINQGRSIAITLSSKERLHNTA